MGAKVCASAVCSVHAVPNAKIKEASCVRFDLCGAVAVAMAVGLAAEIQRDDVMMFLSRLNKPVKWMVNQAAHGFNNNNMGALFLRVLTQSSLAAWTDSTYRSD